jgi:hypothetical protein
MHPRKSDGEAVRLRCPARASSEPRAPRWDVSGCHGAQDAGCRAASQPAELGLSPTARSLPSDRGTPSPRDREGLQTP